MKQFILLLLVALVTSCNSHSLELTTLNNMTFIEKSSLPIVHLERGNFLIDTGSNSSWLSIEYLNSIGHYTPNNTKAFASINYNLEYQTSTINVKVDSITYKFKTISMQNLNLALGIKIIGILGSDFLRDNQLIIDYKNNSIHK